MFLEPEPKFFWSRSKFFWSRRQNFSGAGANFSGAGAKIFLEPEPIFLQPEPKSLFNGPNFSGSGAEKIRCPKLKNRSLTFEFQLRSPGCSPGIFKSSSTELLIKFLLTAANAKAVFIIAVFASATVTSRLIDALGIAVAVCQVFRTFVQVW